MLFRRGVFFQCSDFYVNTRQRAPSPLYTFLSGIFCSITLYIPLFSLPWDNTFSKFVEGNKIYISVKNYLSKNKSKTILFNIETNCIRKLTSINLILKTFFVKQIVQFLQRVDFKIMVIKLHNSQNTVVMTIVCIAYKLVHKNK